MYLVEYNVKGDTVHMDKNILDKLTSKDKPYWVVDILSLISAIMTIITFIFWIADSVLTSKKSSNTFTLKNANTFVIIILFLMLLICVFKVHKYGKLIRNIKKSYSENYYHFLHDFRNFYFDNLNEIKSKGGTLTVKDLTKETKQYLENTLGYLCEILEKGTGEKISACIKLIENHDLKTEIDKENATVITFCRSKNSVVERKTYDGMHKKSILIKDNTDFYEMLCEDNLSSSCFYHANLEEYDKKLKEVGKTYKNSTENYQKLYIGTIVVPIRINHEHLFYTKNDNGYDIIGFLCVDSLSKNAFRESEFEKNVNKNIVKSFAAEIYITLNKYNYYLKKAKGGN